MNASSDIVISLSQRKWWIQFSINFFAVVLFSTMIWFVNNRPEPIAGKESSKILLLVCTAGLGLPSLFVILHLFLVKGKEPISVKNGMLTDRSRVFRSSKNIPVDSITKIRIIYRSRPFTGISREYRADFKRSNENDETSVYLSDYLISRQDLEKLVRKIADWTKIEL